MQLFLTIQERIKLINKTKKLENFNILILYKNKNIKYFNLINN